MTGPDKLRSLEREPAFALGPPPDFFIVGHATSGTTALYRMLAQHPQIFMSRLKEPELFDHDLRPLYQPRHAGPLPETPAEYISLFNGATANQITGEATPTYLSSAAGLINLWKYDGV